jgi:hypothetical protein
LPESAQPGCPLSRCLIFVRATTFERLFCLLDVGLLDEGYFTYFDDIDYCSTNNSTVCAIQSISVPVVFAAMGAHYFIRDNERMHDLAASKDKDFVVIEGAVHGFTPCTRCEKTPGQYSNSVKNLFDYYAKWMNERF